MSELTLLAVLTIIENWAKTEYVRFSIIKEKCLIKYLRGACL